MTKNTGPMHRSISVAPKIIRYADASPLTKLSIWSLVFVSVTQTKNSLARSE